MKLTQTQMDKAQNILNGTENYGGFSGTKGFYTYLDNLGDPYGRLGLGVTDNNSWQGQIANGFMKVGGEDNGVNITYQSSDWHELNQKLAERHLDAYRKNSGGAPDRKQIQEYHNEEYDNIDLDPNDWFPNQMLETSSDPDALWEDWMSNDNSGDVIEDTFDIMREVMSSPAYLLHDDYQDEWLFTKNFFGALGSLDAQGWSQLAGQVNPLNDLKNLIQNLPDHMQNWFGTVMEHYASSSQTSNEQWDFVYKDISSWAQQVVAQTGSARSEASPLVLDLGALGIELTDMNSDSAVYWDLDQDGFAEKTGWVGSQDGLLTLDRNGDGVVTDHSELFGTKTTDGFVILRDLDTNHDNMINQSDTEFDDLRVWVDANNDALSQADELYSLSDLGIKSINLDFTQTNYEISGNIIRSESTFTLANGAQRKIVDAWFQYDDVNTFYSQDVTLDIRTFFLPTARGYGTIPALHVAMSKDGVLLDRVAEIATMSFSDLLSQALGWRLK